MNDTDKRKKDPHFLMKLCSFLIIIFLLDLAAGGLLKHFYFKQGSGLLYRTTYAMDSTRADILIFGSSTANHHYVPAVFEDQLHLSCYNSGRDGNSILYSYAVFRSALKRYTPKMVILDIYDHEFMKDQDSYDRLSSLLPYYQRHPEIRSIARLKSPFEKYKLISKIYPFNSLLFTIGVGNADFNKERISGNDQNGYVPLLNTWRKPLFTDTSFSRYELDKTKIDILESFIKDCRRLDIPLYVCLSPKFIRFEHEDSTVQIVNRITGEFNIPFFNFTNDSFFLNHRDLYSDNDHLNDAGAKIYTEMVLKKIKQKR